MALSVYRLVVSKLFKIFYMAVPYYMAFQLAVLWSSSDGFKVSVAGRKLFMPYS